MLQKFHAIESSKLTGLLVVMLFEFLRNVIYFLKKVFISTQKINFSPHNIFILSSSFYAQSFPPSAFIFI
jgi:hypothetical protein